MNVLIVDDQQAVIDSLKKEVRWDQIPVEKVYTALSAREARMALRNFDVDVLLTDIEMPEEDALSLFRWMRENCPHVVGIFLTAHADFHYAQEAIHMGGVTGRRERYHNPKVSAAELMEKIIHID